MVEKVGIHVIQVKYILKNEMNETVHVTNYIMQTWRILETATHKYSSDTKGFQLLS